MLFFGVTLFLGGGSDPRGKPLLPINTARRAGTAPQVRVQPKAGAGRRPGTAKRTMFSLEHSDFSLIPDPDAPTQWRGVAKTQEGIKALLALWATPLDDPGHPLCVFSWQPTPDALSALHTHCPEVVVRPLDPCEHRALWATQNATAAFSWPLAPVAFSVQREGKKNKDTLLGPSSKEILLELSSPFHIKGDIWRFKRTPSVRWEAYYATAATKGHPWFLKSRIPDAKKRPGKDMETKVTFEHPQEEALFDMMRRTWDDCTQFLSEKGGIAYRYAKKGPLVLVLNASEITRNADPETPFFQPLRLRLYRAFFDFESVPLSFFSLSVQDVHRLDIPLFQAIEKTVSPQAQKTAFLRAHPDQVASWERQPYWAARVWAQKEALRFESPLAPQKDCTNAKELALLFQACLKKDDTFFFDELARVRTDTGATWDAQRGCTTLHERNEPFTHVEDWKTVFALWDVQQGLTLWQKNPDGPKALTALDKGAQALRALYTPGRTSWAALLNTPLAFQTPLNEALGPRVAKGLEDPAFLSALHRVGFWDLMAAQHCGAHPQWQALHERALLTVAFEGGAFTAPRREGPCLS
jgi:hypothetical protein